MSEKKGKVLIIDDQPAEVKIIRLALEMAGYEVIYAYNGEEGIERARQEKPSAIILDIMMPVKDGFKTADELRNDLDCCLIPIIVLTSFGDIALPTRTIEGKFNLYPPDEYLEKPVDPNVLTHAVDKLVARRG